MNHLHHGYIFAAALAASTACATNGDDGPGTDTRSVETGAVGGSDGAGGGPIIDRGDGGTTANGGRRTPDVRELPLEAVTRSCRLQARGEASWARTFDIDAARRERRLEQPRVENSGALAIALADYNSDGDLDAMSTLDGGNTAWLNDASGSISASGISLGTAKTNAIAMTALDNDGDLDMTRGTT